MKNFIVAVLFLGVAAYFGMLLYDSWSNGDWLKSEAVVEEAVVAEVVLSYPAVLDIQSSDGREMSIKLIARNGTHIQFDRIVDGERYVYPMDKLVPQSRARVEAYPSLGLIEVGKDALGGDLNLEDTYVQQLRDAIRRIDDKIKSFSVDFEITQSSTDKRTIVRKLQLLESERLELLSKIAERE
ncbi:MAG: hypothetical protein ACN4GF_00915 [Lentimonas sp.]